MKLIANPIQHQPDNNTQTFIFEPEDSNAFGDVELELRSVSEGNNGKK